MKNIPLIIILFFPYIVFSQSLNRYIIKTKSNNSEERLKTILKLRQADDIKPIFNELNLYSLILEEDGQRVISELEKNNKIEYIVEDLPLEYRNTPNDIFYKKQYAPSIIKADEVWDNNTGGLTGVKDTIVVAVLDLGMFAGHEDLKDNIWKNYADKPGDKIDNDGNGYIDDHSGLDIATKTDALNSHYHGTGVAGIIGAKGNNNIGISGINWNIKILPITSIRYISDVIEGYNYIYNLRKSYNNSNGVKGAFIVCTNLSAGYDKTFPDDSQAFTDWCNIYDLLGTQGILSVTSASNDDMNVEIEGDMPTLCTSQYLIPVTSTDENDKFDVTKSFGSKSIDIAAPGRAIYTLTTDNAYRKDFTGNSAAAPHVAGAIGLIYTIPCQGFTDKIKANPSELSLKIKEYLLTYSDKHSDLKDKTLCGGRLNIYNTYIHLAELCGALPTNKLLIKTIAPNPAYNNTTIEYDIENYDNHTLNLYNASGKLVIREIFKPNIFGTRSINIDVSSFPTGVYYLTLVSGDNSVSKPLVISRK
ncbi:MAG: S8 family peptidase [Saprospiraceae bacterium]|nr:S8 family peptidase [Saprospiraceae bacterium]